MLHEAACGSCLNCAPQMVELSFCEMFNYGEALCYSLSHRLFWVLELKGNHEFRCESAELEVFEDAKRAWVHLKDSSHGVTYTASNQALSQGFILEYYSISSQIFNKLIPRKWFSLPVLEWLVKSLVIFSENVPREPCDLEMGRCVYDEDGGAFISDWRQLRRFVLLRRDIATRVEEAEHGGSRKVREIWPSEDMAPSLSPHNPLSMFS